MNPASRIRCLMSMLVINEVLKRSRVKGSARLCLLVLAHHCDDTGRKCYPSLTVLSREVGISVRGLCKILKQLEATKEIERTNPTKGGWNARTQYDLSKYAANTVHESSVLQDSAQQDGVDTVLGDTVNTVLQDRRTKPSINLQVNHHNNGRSKKSAIVSDSRIKPLIVSFSEKYQAKSGRAYPIKWGKDGKSLKELLATGETPEAITAAMDLYFADDFYSQIGFDIGKFCNAFSSLVSRSKSNGRGKFQSVPAPGGKYAKYS
jgi:hypothetical protein